MSTVAIRLFALTLLLAVVQGTDPSRNFRGLKKLAKTGDPSSLAPAGVADYYISTEKVTYYDAVDLCLSYDLRPLQVKTSTKYEEVVNLLKMNAVAEPVYIGLTDLIQDGRWMWFDGSDCLYPCLSPTFKKWAPGMGGTGVLDCAVIDPLNDYLFIEVACANVTTTYLFACEVHGNPCLL